MSTRTSTPARMNFAGLLRKGKKMNENQFEEFIRGNEQFDRT